VKRYYAIVVFGKYSKTRSFSDIWINSLEAALSRAERNIEGPYMTIEENAVL
jgi:hypothetical protein